MLSATVARVTSCTPTQPHDCKQFTVQTVDGEFCCLKCGRVDTEAQARYLQEMGIDDGQRILADDHNSGSGLLDSQTMQASYVSPGNKGVAFALHDPRGRDFAGKKIKMQLANPYRSGLLADPSRGVHTEEDPLTGAVRMKFSTYDLPTLHLMKGRALSLCMSLGLDTVQQTLVARDVKQVYSRLVMGPLLDYAALVGILNRNGKIPKHKRKELEEMMAACVEEIRNKVLSGCGLKAKSS